MRAPSARRASISGGRGDDTGDGDDGRPRFRLVVTRGKLAVELAAPFVLGPLEVRELALSLPDARFPVDLSGGVHAFRDRRGVLERLVVAVRNSAEALALDLRALFGGERPEVLVAPTADGFFVGARGGEAALAFEVIVVAAGSDLRLIPVEARALGLAAAPQAVAMSMLLAATRPFGHRIGGAVLVERAARHVVERLLPLSGLRVPDVERTAWSAPVPELGALVLVATSEVGMAPSPRAVRAIETAALAADGDDALARGDHDRARAAYLETLERAPRHPELVRRLAELDRSAGRLEVALGVLADLGGDADADVLVAALLLGKGDRDGARMAFERAAETEPYGALAAACWAKLAEALDGTDSLAALDRAVSRAPTWTTLRWRRFHARLAAGDLDGAVADAGELEVAARGADLRHAVARRVAEALLRARHLEPAASWFDRALRFRPDGPEALAGLARSLGTLGKSRRALELLVRAVGLDRRRRGGDGHPRPSLVLELARALVDHADDRPAAVAHVRSIPTRLPESFEARFLEGRWRAELGDTAGATEAFARLGDEVERGLGALLDEGDVGSLDGVSARAARRDLANAVASQLEEAARIEEHDRGDRLAARRFLGLALRLAPQRASLQASFRRISAETVKRQPSNDTELALPPPRLRASMSDPVEDELLVESLTERLRADPREFSLVLELAGVLERLARDHELLALLSARIDEETEPQRQVLVTMRRTVLARMHRLALAEGREDEAHLYELLAGRE